MSNDPLSIVYLPVALGLGALHALEPGHAKTMIAAYLIGTKGTRWDALLLGIAAAATNSIVVIALALTALFLGTSVFTDHAVEWLQIASGLTVILLGCWMLWRRLSPRFRHVEHHHHAPEPIAVVVDGRAIGQIAIVDTPAGERMRLTLDGHAITGAQVGIAREDGIIEELVLAKSSTDASVYESAVAPQEPHEFTAVLTIQEAAGEQRFAFAMEEPEHHHHGDHDHEHHDDVAHARAHAADLPAYVQKGERPTTAQVLAFGAAGGLMPCPASVTVMLLALSVGKMAVGVLAVGCFSLGLAVTMVSIGMVVVIGVERLSGSGRFTWISRRAPAVSAAVVILSGITTLLVHH